MLIKWRESFKTGIRSVDYEHERLIDVINELGVRLSGEGAPPDVAATLGEIHGLIEAHFALEEKLMRDMRYVGYAAHKADHDRLLDEIRVIMDDAEAGGTAVRETLSTRLKDWFQIHFGSFDRDFHHHAVARR